MAIAVEDLSRFVSQLREPTPQNVATDLDFLRRGVLDPESFRLGYMPWRDCVVAEHRSPDGELLHVRYGHNVRTNVGGDWQAAQLSSAVNGLAAYMALASDSVPPANTDTYLGGSGSNTNTEITTGGLGRVLATYAHTAITTISDTSVTNPGIYTLSGHWTVASGFSFSGITKCGIFNAASGGSLILENTFASVDLNPGDTFFLTYMITY